MEDYEIWGYAVSKMREKRGITQGKLAEQLGYSSSHSSHGYVGNHWSSAGIWRTDR